MKKIVTIITYLLICGFALYISAAAQTIVDTQPKPSQAALASQAYVRTMGDIADLLGWSPAPNLCRGFYREPASITAVPTPAPISSTETTITADQPSLLSQTGTSTLQGNVTVTQPGREVMADRAYIYRDPNTRKMSRVELLGNVHYRESGKLLVGNRASLNLVDKSAEIDEAAYRISRPRATETLNAWGTVEEATREPSGILNLYNATYSTCAPVNPEWEVRAQHIRLDQESGRGSATNAHLYAMNFPIFYLPYFDFPIDHRRYTGFLYPTVTYSPNQNGLDVSIPYYLNLAPNYDDTFTPRIMTRRGIELTNFFRYLTPSSNGALLASFIPRDSAFQQFINSAPQQFPNTPVNAPFLADIAGYSSTRGYVSFQDNTAFNPNWSTAINVNYVTDDYFFQDLGNTPVLINTDQLPSQGDLNYQSEHWRFLGRLQAFQTLHIINQDLVMDQYARLPQLALTGNFPDEAYGLHYTFNNEIVNFQHDDDYFTGQPFPTGLRANFNPIVSRPLISLSGYFTPQLQLEATQYALNNNTGSNANLFDPNAPTTINPSPGQPDNITRVLPMLDIDSGLYYERDASLFSYGYRQTFEPRLFYLYVPFVSQGQIPVFDTTLPSFSYEQLYRTNRFVGYDRIGDANQVSAGFTTRILDHYTGEDKLDFSVGEIFYLQKHRVCIYSDCSDDTTIDDQVSPIAAKLNYNLTPAWSAYSTIAYDSSRSQTDNASAHLLYMPAPQHIVNVGYDFVRNGDLMNSVSTAGPNTDLSRFDINFVWPIHRQISALADWNYNLSHGHFQTYSYGLEYNSCCWAMRFVTNRTLLSEDINGNLSYANNYFFQVMLKGLGNIGNSDPSNLLISTIPGYRDNFRG